MIVGNAPVGQIRGVGFAALAEPSQPFGKAALRALGNSALGPLGSLDMAAPRYRCGGL
ncbi:MAG: hypothetical protein OXH83_18680 [Bryobacterales bacterium]|nr:hypothetical protein [Bryobacterales bacterium]